MKVEDSVFKPIKWHDCNNETGSAGKFLMFEYDIWKDDTTSKWAVTYYNILTEEPSKDATGFSSNSDAKKWAFRHLNIKMKPYLK